MHKLSDTPPVIERKRIYRLYTERAQENCVYEFPCFNWDENMANFVQVMGREWDASEQDTMTWTLEWLDEEREQKKSNDDNRPD